MWGEPVTMFFTDIVGSTRMLERLDDRFIDLLEEHNRILRESIDAYGGREVRVAGDSFFAVFADANDAVRCARRAQLALATAPWPGEEKPQVRMGIHTGAPAAHANDFAGMDVHRAARVMAVAHGTQVLLTDDTRQALESSWSVRDLGFHRLKDLSEPEHLFQLLAPDLPSEFPPLRSLNRSNLPVPPNRLIGRELEVDRALGMLTRSDLRVLTLLGPGGAGKTRLAIEVAAEAVSHYRDGAWIVPLAPIGEQRSIVSELAKVLAVDPIGGQPLEETLLAALFSRELLLVLDNFEHLLDAADLVAGMIAQAPKVDVLITSREPLRIRAEHRLDVPPLTHEHATELFIERALAVHPELTLDGEDRVAIERICSRLDCLPLAVELAAARTAVFGPRALESRLAERLELPVGPRDLPKRQRTLKATIDWSYRLLDLDEATLFRALAPFVGGVRIDSAESIWGPDAIDLLISLTEKSLLRRREDRDQEPRFWMLETIRQFVLEQATKDGIAQAAAGRHAGHYLELAEEIGPRLVTSDQARCLDRLEAEHANVRAALDHLTTQAPDQALRMAGHLTRSWEIRGYIPEGRRRLSDALAATTNDHSGRARGLFGSGRLAFLAGDALEAVPLLRKAAALARAAGDSRLAIESLANLDGAAAMLGDIDLSDASGEQAIAVARSAGDEWALAIALNNRANRRMARGDVTAARPLLKESLALRRRSGEPRGIALTSYNLVQVMLGAGELEAAEALLDDALAHARKIEYHVMTAALLSLGALLALQKEDTLKAQTQLGAAIDEMPGPDPELLVDLFEAAAAVAAIRGKPFDAAMLWGAAEMTLAQIGRVEPPAAVPVRTKWLPVAMQDAADEQAWNTARTAGIELSQDDALHLAAEQTTPRVTDVLG